MPPEAMASDLPTTLVDVLATRGDSNRRIHYLDGQNDRRSVTFSGLRSAAVGVLFHLQAFGAQPGDRVILHTSSNEQFLDGFWACLLGGLVPVPVAVGISDDHRLKLLQVFATLGNPLVYTEEGQRSRLQDYGRASGTAGQVDAVNRRSLFVEQVTDISRPGREHPVMPDDVAFIQFSSGSTSTPKGVLLTHRNLLTNIRAMIEGARFTDQDISLSWMPLTHDMGLIGLHLCMLTANIEHTIMDTRVFSRRPLLWLEEASRLRATVLCSPNFGYKHFLKVYDSKGVNGLDLSAVRLLINGAEPISIPLCERFMQEMQRFGLARTAMYPVYGLAEASLAVTLPGPGHAYRSVLVERASLAVGSTVALAEPGTASGLELMTVGKPVRDCELRVAGDDDLPLAAGTVGHLQIRGGNVTSGYVGLPADQQPLTADGWLRTGDLGFLTVPEGDLVVTGRQKEIIFVNGLNYYPNDLEAIAEKYAGVELGKMAAAGSRKAGGEDEELLLFLLNRGSAADFLPVANQLRRQITEHTGLNVAHVIPVRNLPKTTSGKLQRGKLAQAYADGEYDAVVAELDALAVASARKAAAGGSDLQTKIRHLCASVITDREIGLDDDFFELGVSSLSLAQIHERIDEEYPGQLDVEDLFTKSTIRAVAAHLEEKGL
ncbi:MAG: AMP-dependent synthetase [Gammaproteobacteria bacterium]|nr:AMP-dependent synthetase [Gammaproteobacteria bacterium]